MFIDLLFFNRELNCMVAVDLKAGKFRLSYLGQMAKYLIVLDDTVRKPHENPSIGLILFHDMNKAFVDYIIRDYAKPLGVAIYSTTKEMSENMKNAIPDPEELKQLVLAQNVEDKEIVYGRVVPTHCISTEGDGMVLTGFNPQKFLKRLR